MIAYIMKEQIIKNKTKIINRSILGFEVCSAFWGLNDSKFQYSISFMVLMILLFG